MIRRTGLGLAAVISLVLVAGCSSSSGTPTPTPISDPQVLITQAIGQVPDIGSFHLKIALSGKIDAAALGGSGLGLGGSFDLAGTTLEGDVDVKKQAADLKFSMPSLLGLSGEIIVVDGYSYTKISLQGDKYSKSKLSDLTGSLPVSVPSAMPSPGALTDEVAQLRDALQAMGVTTTMKGEDTIDGKAAYHVEVGLPLSTINTLLASEGGDSAAGMKLDSAAIDFWIYKDGLLPAKFELQGSAASLGSLDVVITITAYNQAVTISAPSADQIQAS